MRPCPEQTDSKHGPLARMAIGDWLVYYSPTIELGGAPLRAFTALGRVSGEQVYRFDMGDGFVPYRRDVAYERVRGEAPIRALAPRLSFVRDNPRWGMLARRGHFEIDPNDIAVIAEELGVSSLARAGGR